MQKFARKQGIKRVITKVILFAFFCCLSGFLRTQANPDRSYDLLTTLYNCSLTFRSTVQNGADYAVAKAKNIYHNEHWRAKALFFAVRHNYKTMLEYFLQYFSANMVDEISGKSLLMATGDVEAAKLLLDYGAEVNYVSKEGNTELCG